jgi:hypothetical protein
VSPAKAVINSDRAIAEKLTGAWLPCQESSALQWPAQPNYRLKPEDVLKLQNNPPRLITRDLKRPIDDFALTVLGPAFPISRPSLPFASCGLGRSSRLPPCGIPEHIARIVNAIGPSSVSPKAHTQT